MQDFKFIDPGPLADNELELALVKTVRNDQVPGLLPYYVFEMRVGDRKAGKVSLRVGNTHNIVMYGGHIGYGVEPEFRGHHYAERACRLVLPIAKAHGLETICITCNPDNWPSRRTCERLGATLVEIVDLPVENDQYRDGDRQKCRYRIDLSS